MQKQPWIGKPIVDTVFILLPPFLSLFIIFLFPSLFLDSKDIPDAGWVILILLIDVAHVYSTLYRTYFDSHSFNKQKNLLIAIPFIGFIVGVLAYSVSSQFFWRLLAYTAVFHFIRQQYGFMRVYSRKENTVRWKKIVDKLVIYYATIYPILYWHLKGPRNFNWFIENDFAYLQSVVLMNIVTVIYFVVVGVYVIKEVMEWIHERFINIPKLAIISGTLLSWYFGIVYFNGDMAFTLLNVVSHGIPYMALIWIYGQKNYNQTNRGNRFLKLVFSTNGIFIFLGLIFLFAFIEEGLWDIAVWKEHAKVFGFAKFSDFTVDNEALVWIVPLLALPQITHYILDGFIWRIRKDDFKWNSEVTKQNT